MILWNYPNQKEIPLSELAGKRVIAFCGLAYPESLAFSLKQLQADPVNLVKFPDHTYYREKDLRYLETLARSLKDQLAGNYRERCLETGSMGIRRFTNPGLGD